MVAVFDFVIFAAALGTAVVVIAAMVVPQWARIAALATGHTERTFTPLSTLAGAERRIAVRRWASQSATGAFNQWREAA